MDRPNQCPKCGGKIIGIEYRLTPEDYDGISEWRCDCGYRVGRWSGLELQEGFIEKRWGGEPVDVRKFKGVALK